MYNREVIDRFLAFIAENDGIADKKCLSDAAQQEFQLTQVRSVFYCDWFAVRFCTAQSRHFSNTVSALSKLLCYDEIPFFVCVVTKQHNYLMLANTTFLKKISHSSQKLRQDNIRGSFNGSDIMQDFNGIANIPANFEFLFSSHENYPFEENLVRLVEATNGITPTGRKFTPFESEIACIRQSVDRAVSFLNSQEYQILKDSLDARVQAAASEIAYAAAFIDNVNLRGRVIEYLITATDDQKAALMQNLRTNQPLPQIFTANALGDYAQNFDCYRTQTDIKTKLLFRSSNPKGYNIDKVLAFLAEEKSVYLVYVVAIDEDGTIQTQLCSLFNRQLLRHTRIIEQWAGRNSRGVTQYDGHALEDIINHFDRGIDCEASQDFLKRCLDR